MTYSSTDARHLNELAARIGLPEFNLSPENAKTTSRRLHLALRRAWFEHAHKPADATLKSPCAGTTVRMPGGDTIQFGYERDLDVSILEKRGALDHPTPDGWTSSRVLCRSGQSTLSCLLHLVTSSGAPARPSHPAPRRDATSRARPSSTSGPAKLFRQVPALASEVDVLLGEPVFCDGRFGVSAIRALFPAHAWPCFSIRRSWAAAVDLSAGSTASMDRLSRSSGRASALDQAGLELANVGIVQLFVREGAGVAAANNLRRIRGLTGSGLTLDKLAALSAPWFLDRTYLKDYTAAIFAHWMQRSAARSRRESAVFEERSHPSLVRAGAEAPFCAVRLRGGDGTAHRRLLEMVEAEIGGAGYTLLTEARSAFAVTATN